MPANHISRPRWLWMVLLLCSVLPNLRAVQAQECVPSTAEQFNQLLDQSRSKIYLVKFDDALERLDAAEALLPCLTEALSRESLSRMFLYRGVAAFNKGNERQTMLSFRQAVATDRATRWDDRFGQRPREIFIEAKESALMAQKGAIRLPELKPDVQVFIDGELTSGGTVAPAVPGRHLMQVKAGDRFVRGALFDVISGAEAQAPVPTTYVGRSNGVASGSSQAVEPSGSGAGTQQVRVKEQPPVERKPFDKTRLRPVSFVSLGVGGLALLAGAGAGIVTWTTQRDLLENYYSNRDSEERDALLDRQRMTAYLADGALGAAVVFGGVGASLFLVSRPGEAGAGGTSSFYPLVGPQTVGLGWQGAF